MAENNENGTGVPAPDAAGKNGKKPGKKKPKAQLRAFVQQDIRDLEGILKNLESKTKMTKEEALEKLTPSIIANIRKGWKPIEIAKVLKTEGRMAAVRQTDILRVLKLALDEGSITEDDVRLYKLKAIMSIKEDAPVGQA